MKKIILYARFSPRPNAAECDSADNQIADLLADAAKRGETVDPADIYKDEDWASGDDWNRPGLWAAVRAVTPGAELRVRNFDRLARDVSIMAFVRYEVLS